MNELEIRLRRLQAQIDGQAETIRERGQAIANLNAQNKELREIIAGKDGTNNKLRAMIGELEEENEELKRRHEHMVENINKLIEKYREG